MITQRDIVNRLHAAQGALHLEASDEIEHLRGEVERLREIVRQRTRLLDDQLGAPCEQIRHEQEIERIHKAAGEELREKDEEIERLRKSPDSDVLKHIISVCDDNADAACNQAMALAFVRSIAAAALTGGQLSPENNVRWALEQIIQSCDIDDDADQAEPGSRPRDCYVISSDLIEQARKAVSSGS